jgi:hypothetical protein
VVTQGFGLSFARNADASARAEASNTAASTERASDRQPLAIALDNQTAQAGVGQVLKPLEATNDPGQRNQKNSGLAMFEFETLFVIILTVSILMLSLVFKRKWR